MSAPEGSKNRDYSRYDQMSTAELEQLLRLDFQTSEAEESDLDTILYLSDLLARRNGPSDSDAAWTQFQTKYRPCANGRSLYDLGDGGEALPPSPRQPSVAQRRPRHTRRLRRLAVLAAILAACLLSGIVAQAAGVDILGSIARWTDETFRFVSPSSASVSGSGSTSDTGQGDTGQPQSLLQSLGMESRFPTWHPDGFFSGGLNITELNGSISAHVTFSADNRSYSVSIVHYTQPHDKTGTFEKDDTPVEEYDHNGQTFYILSNLDTLTATTYDGEFLTMIGGMLTREEIKAVIDSIPAPLPAKNLDLIQARLAEQGQSLYLPKIPQGFTQAQSQFYIDPTTEEIFWSELYTRGNENLMFGLILNKGISQTVYEKDDTPVEEYVYHGTTHYIFSNNGTTTATWMVENTEYYMWATDGAVDMKELIRSVYETG